MNNNNRDKYSNSKINRYLLDCIDDTMYSKFYLFTGQEIHFETRVICDPTGSTGCLRCECKQVAPHTGAALVRQSSQGEIEKENLVVYMLRCIPNTDKAW